jgi:branched-chain amino acid transport system substrate-binding protein
MTMRNRSGIGTMGRASALGLALLLALALGPGRAQAKEYLVGLLCDRSGPTKSIGNFMCEGALDYVKLFNSKNSLGAGNSVKLMEIDFGYNVPRGIEAYERFKAAGVVSVASFGTPITVALTPKLTEDKTLETAPGFGLAASANGKAFPYVFPVAASYWDQAGSAIKFIMDKQGGKKTKIAYLYYDNPAGTEPMPVFNDLQKTVGFELKTFAVPPPGIDMRPQVLDITRNYKPDWVITHLFGRAPSVSIKELARMGFPMDHVLSFTWGAAESDIQAAGPDNAEGYYGLQFTGVGQNFDVLNEIKSLYQKEGKAPPEAMAISAYYNRGVLYGALHARAIQLAIEKHGPDITGDNVKEGMEAIRNFDLGGLLPPLNITPEDHEGGGWVKIYQWKGGKWNPATDYFQGYRDVVMKHVRAVK